MLSKRDEHGASGVMVQGGEGAKLPCGHPASAMTFSAEKGNLCGMCAKEQRTVEKYFGVAEEMEKPLPESTREILAEMQRVCREISEHREQLVYTALVHDNCPECGQRPRKVVWVIPLIPRADKLLVERLLCTCDRGHSWYAGKIESAIKTDSLEGGS